MYKMITFLYTLGLVFTLGLVSGQGEQGINNQQQSPASTSTTITTTTTINPNITTINPENTATNTTPELTSNHTKQNDKMEEGASQNEELNIEHTDVNQKQEISIENTEKNSKVEIVGKNVEELNTEHTDVNTKEEMSTENTENGSKVELVEKNMENLNTEHKDINQNAEISTENTENDSKVGIVGKKGDGGKNNTVNLVDGRVTTRPGQLVKCQCGADEVLTSTGCQYYPNTTYIFREGEEFQPSKMGTSNLHIVVYEPECKTQDGHREMTFEGNQFYLRQRGDIVLMGDVGDLEGLRINNYCVSHYMDEEGRVSWSLKKACIPPPSVPRCCPPGEAMNEEGRCEPTDAALSKLLPPVSADIFNPGVHWPVIKNHLNTITCDKDPMKSIPLDPGKSRLLNVPTGMVHIWHPDVEYISRKYTYPDNFCVDAVKSYWGKVEYSAKLCFTDPMQQHQEACQGNTCIRKCCKEDEVMNNFLYRCVPQDNTSMTYEPPFTSSPAGSYETVVGFPLCGVKTEVTNVSINADGFLIVGKRVLSPTHYCSDVFLDDKGIYKHKALACLNVTSQWDRIRSTLMPVLIFISIVFLLLTVSCYFLLPALRRSGGWCHVFHATSLMFAYVTSFIQHFGYHWGDVTCVSMALVMQFWYLCTFFWLTLLCFDAWRRIRSLNTKQPSPDTPLSKYIIFGYGGPFVISLVTIIIHFFVPDDTQGIIKPSLGISRCWFQGTKELLAYFYGPSAVLFTVNILLNALTFTHYLNLRKTSPGLQQLEEGNRERSEVTGSCKSYHAQYSRDVVADFKQQFYLLVLMSTCWVFEILSWKIPPPETWAFTDILTTLQGVFIFAFFVANATKRQHLERKYPAAFALFRKGVSCLCCRRGGEEDKEIMSTSSSVSNFSNFEESSPSSTNESNVKSEYC